MNFIPHNCLLCEIKRLQKKGLHSSMEEKLVSAVIITHNRKELVLKAIDSVMKQTYTNIEVIVVDDASDDGTKEILSKESEKIGFRYIYIPKEESKGGNHARNVGIQAAVGEYIAFLDDDDEWLPEKTSLQVDFLNKNVDCEMVHCGKLYEYNFSKIKKSDIEKIPEGNFRKKIFSRIAFTTSCLMVRKDFFKKVGLFDEQLKFWQEYEFAIRACQLSDIGAVHRHLVLYRIIQKDKNRLTNKVVGWEEAVRYIEKKHEGLLKQLTSEQMKAHKIMVAKDGVLRAVNGGDRVSKRKYLKQIYKLEPTLKNFIKFVVNRERLAPWRGER